MAGAMKGATAITFCEDTEALGFPSIHDGSWDPFFAACEETDTVVNLHIGSSGASPTTSDDAPPDVTGVLFFGFAMTVALLGVGINLINIAITRKKVAQGEVGL